MEISIWMSLAATAALTLLILGMSWFALAGLWWLITSTVDRLWTRGVGHAAAAPLTPGHTPARPQPAWGQLALAYLRASPWIVGAAVLGWLLLH